MSDPQLHNAQALRARFAAAVVAQRPTSVLDFGCGNGQVMELLQQAGIPVTGFESAPETRAQLEGSGFAVLPIPDDDVSIAAENDAFDWVVIRHVLHHLEDPAALVQDAMRVARRGLVFADPFFDPSLPCQRVAEDLDLWLKRQHRRAGRVHHPNIPSATLVGMARAAGAHTVQWDQHVALRPRPLELALAEAGGWAEKLSPESTDHRELRQLRLRAAATGISCNGSTTVIAAK